MNTSDALLVELQYFPCLEYFAAWQKAPQVIVEASETYQKQSPRNRCYILGANRVEMLSVPVLKKSGIYIRDIRIDYSTRWHTNHWRTIYSAYGKAPYFEYFADQVEKVLNKKHLFLFDLNIEALTLCLKILRLNDQFQLSEEYLPLTQVPSQGINDKRDYFNENLSLFTLNGEYHQAFGNKFVKNLSVLDLIFNEGPLGKTFIGQKQLNT